MHPFSSLARRAIVRLPTGVIRSALVVRLLDEWWSYLPAGTVEDQRLDLGISYTQAGWLLALLTLGGLVVSPIAARADRGDRRLLAVVGALLLAGGLAAFALSASYAVLVAAAVVLGGASDLVIRPLESALADTATHDLDRLLGRQHLVTWLGDFIGPALLAVGAATVLGWQGVFGITSVVFVAFAVVLALTEFPAPAVDDDEADASRRQSFRALVRMPEVALLAGAEFILLPLDEVFLGFAVARLVDDGFGPAAQLLAAGLVVGGLSGSVLIARRGIDVRLTRWALAAMVVGAFAAAAPLGVAAQVSAMVVFGWATAVVWAKVHHRMLTVVTGRSAAVSTIVSLVSTPALLVPVAMGAVSDSFSITVALVGAATLTIALAAVVSQLGGDRIAADAVAQVLD